jgi:hypothetical protein
MKERINDSDLETQRREADIRLIVEHAKTIWHRIDTMHYLDLVKLFLAFSHVPDFDPDAKYRLKILALLPDWIVEAEFNNIKMPIRLAKIIEDRLRPPPPEDPNSIDFGGTTVTPIPENE